MSLYLLSNCFLLKLPITTVSCFVLCLREKAKWKEREEAWIKIENLAKSNPQVSKKILYTTILTGWCSRRNFTMFYVHVQSVVLQSVKTIKSSVCVILTENPSALPTCTRMHWVWVPLKPTLAWIIHKYLSQTKHYKMNPWIHNILSTHTLQCYLHCWKHS